MLCIITMVASIDVEGQAQQSSRRQHYPRNGRDTRARPDFFAGAPTGINCASGFIRFADDGIPSQEAHAPEHRCRHVLKGSWISDRIFYDMKSDGPLLRRLIEGGLPR